MVIPLLANQDLMPMLTNTIYTKEHRVSIFSYKMLHEAVSFLICICTSLHKSHLSSVLQNMVPNEL